jgi:imidazolonepropionase-like amidohydrolase
MPISPTVPMRSAYACANGEELLKGASQTKLVVGGGVASPRTTLDMFTFSEPEFRASVEAASDRNTYAAVHAYPPAQIRRAIAVGASAPSTST